MENAKFYKFQEFALKLKNSFEDLMGNGTKEHIAANHYNDFLLASDVGGTNTSFGLIGIKKKNPFLLSSMHCRTAGLSSYYSAMREALEIFSENHRIKITKGCIAVAGTITATRDKVKMTNAGIEIDKKRLIRIAKLKKISFLNDFEAIGYSINVLKLQDFRTIRKGRKLSRHPAVVIGAGTGLGKTGVIFNESLGCYTPLASESGHWDFPAEAEIELGLASFIKGLRKKDHVSYEDVLSHRGIINIFDFLKSKKTFKETNYTREVKKSAEQPEMISKFRKKDRMCQKTFEIFRKNYAKFARNCAIDFLAYGGVYIAGGIGRKNPDIFDDKFIKEFEDNSTMSKVLKSIPIYLITNPDSGILGAGYFGARFL